MSDNIKLILTNSFEENRDDDRLISIFDKYRKEIISSINYPQKLIRDKKSIIKIPPTIGIFEILYLLRVLSKILRYKSEIDALNLTYNLITEIRLSL